MSPPYLHDTDARPPPVEIVTTLDMRHPDKNLIETLWLLCVS